MKDKEPEAGEVEKTEQERKEVKMKEEAEKMTQIWKKQQEPLDPEKVVEADLDEFLEDMFM